MVNPPTLARLHERCAACTPHCQHTWQYLLLRIWEPVAEREVPSDVGSCAVTMYQDYLPVSTLIYYSLPYNY